MTVVGRSQVVVPDLGTTGGASLKTAFDDMIKTLSDNSPGRVSFHTSVNDSTEVEITHNLGSLRSQLRVLIFTGTDATKNIVMDPVAAGWVFADGTNIKTQIKVTTPSSGQPHNFTVVILDAQVAPEFAEMLLAAVPADNAATGTVKKFRDANGVPKTKSTAGVVTPDNYLKVLHVNSNFNVLPGYHYAVDTSGGPVTGTLPATVQDYDMAEFSDATESFNTNNFTIARNGNTIRGLAEDLVLSTPGDGALLVGDNTASNWIRASSGGAGGSGSGEGITNYVVNGSAENDLNDVTATNVTLAAETTDPLWGTQSFKLTSIASAGTVDWDLGTIDNFVEDAALAVELRASIEDQAAGGSDGDWTIGIYNTTDAEYAVGPIDILTGQRNIVKGFLAQLVAGKTYVVRVNRLISSAGDDLLIDKVVVTPDAGVTIPIAGPTSYGVTREGKQILSTGSNVTILATDVRDILIKPTADIDVTLPLTGVVEGDTFTIRGISSVGDREMTFKADDGSIIDYMGHQDKTFSDGNWKGTAVFVANTDEPADSSDWDVVEIRQSGLFRGNATNIGGSFGAITTYESPYQRDGESCSYKPSFFFPNTPTLGQSIDFELPFRFDISLAPSNAISGVMFRFTFGDPYFTVAFAAGLDNRYRATLVAGTGEATQNGSYEGVIMQVVSSTT